MKTKRKKKEKKKMKRKEVRFRLDSNSDPSTPRMQALPLSHVEHTGRSVEILLLKPSILIKHEFKDIFQSLDSENPT